MEMQEVLQILFWRVCNYCFQKGEDNPGTGLDRLKCGEHTFQYQDRGSRIKV
jgi:hypothetical protein